MDKKLEKIIDLKLDASDRDAERHGLIQYNYGQILRIHGLDLPPAVEIQFSYREKGGTTENRIGTTKDGITEVQIPDKMLKNNGTTQDYAIWVFVYVTDETSGNTVCRIKLYVDSRPAPGEIGEDPEEKRILDEAVEMVNQAADRAEAAERGASDQAAAAEQSKTDAAESAETAKKYLAETEEVKEETVKELTELSESVKTVIADGEESIAEKQTLAEKSITDHTDTEIARLDRETQASEERLTETIRTANNTAEAVENTASEARRAKESLDASVRDATETRETVAASVRTANAAKKNLDQSTADANVAKTALDKTIQSADDQNTSLGEKIETSKQLKTDLQTAGEKATQDIHTAGAEERSQMTQIAEQFQESIDALTPDDEIVDGKPWTSKKIIDTLCPELQETGNPVTCYPVEGYPLDITVSWEPTQAGSGDPYPGGCGKNLLDIRKCQSGYKQYNLTITIEEDVVNIKGIPNTTMEYASFVIASAPDYRLSGLDYKITAFCAKGSVKNVYGLRSKNEKEIAVTMPLTTGQTVDVALRLMVSVDVPSEYEPYENIWPISGYDQIKISKYGKNILKGTKTFADIDHEVQTVLGKIQKDELFHGCYTLKTNRAWHGYKINFEKIAKRCKIKVGDVLTYSIWTRFDGIPIKERGSYAFYGTDTRAGKSMSAIIYEIPLTKKAKEWIQLHYTMTVTEEMLSYNSVRIESNYFEKTDDYSTSVANAIFACPKLELGSAPSGFSDTDVMEPESRTFSLPDMNYGGNLNINGEGMQKWVLLTLDGTEDWWKEVGKTANYVFFVKNVVNPLTTCICNMFRWKQYAYASAENEGFFAFESNGIGLHFCVTETWDTIDAWKAFLAAEYAKGTPVQIVCKLAEPVPFTATGGQQIHALPGVNTIITDADSATVKAREDLTHYINRKFDELSSAIVASASEAE